MASPSLLRDLLDYTQNPRFASSTPEERQKWLAEQPSASMGRQFVETAQTLPETPEAETFEEATKIEPALTPVPKPDSAMTPARFRQLTASRFLETYAARQDAPPVQQEQLLLNARTLAAQLGASDVWEATGDKEQVAAYVARNVEKLKQDFADVPERSAKQRKFFAEQEKAGEWLGLLDNLARCEVRFYDVAVNS